MKSNSGGHKFVLFIFLFLIFPISTELSAQCINPSISFLDIPASGGGGEINLNSNGCEMWNVTSSSSWFSFWGDWEDGIVGVYADANTGEYRTGTIQIYDASYQITYEVTINQPGGCQMPASPGTISGTSSLCNGSNGSFSINPVPEISTYYWYVNSYLTYSGSETTVSIPINSGISPCIVSVRSVNECGESDPSEKSVTVTMVPNITQQPVTITKQTGETGTFSITATGTSISYQWEYRVGQDAVWTIIPSATLSAYSITNITGLMSGYQYRCKVSNVCSTLYSNIATLQVVFVSASNTVNYIHYSEPKIPVTDTASIRILNYPSCRNTIEYYDGLGRPVQTVMAYATPSGKDIILPRFYDDLDRESVLSLPFFESGKGEYRTNVTETSVNNFYNGTSLIGRVPDLRAITTIGYDNSPLNREVSRLGVGKDWELNNKKSSISYPMNTSAITSKKAEPNNVFKEITYLLYGLYVNEFQDEDTKVSREYKDKSGRVVIKETKLDQSWLRTSYIYNNLGQLCCVMPPEASDPVTDAGLCYFYKYDEKGRMIEKTIPDGGTTKMVYDKRDRLRLSQNAEQSDSNMWSFIKYDELNRPVVTGKVKFVGNYDAVNTAIETNSLNEEYLSSGYMQYTNLSFPKSDYEVLSATYYDTYTFIDNISDNDSLNPEIWDNGIFDISEKVDLSPGRMPTGAMIKVLNSGDPSFIKHKELYSATYYDKYGHVLRQVSENHLGGMDASSNVYEDITYQVVNTRQEHYKGSVSLKIDKRFTYDHQGRLLTTKLKLNNLAEVTVSSNQYNELGEFVKKSLHSRQTSGTMSFDQDIDYKYNIRGWLISINDPAASTGSPDLFAMELYYNSLVGLGSFAPASGNYNGNITAVKWINKNDTLSGYKFSYDGLNRLTLAESATGPNLDQQLNYNNESIIKYTNNGNIKELKRYYRNNLVDDLVYDYELTSNKISGISDTGFESAGVNDYPGPGNSYSYDLNGNLTHDPSKDIDILNDPTINKPVKLITGTSRELYYHYLSNGNKIGKHSIDGSIIHTDDYINNIVYTDGVLTAVLDNDMRLLNESGTWKYEYYMKDHLGNTRVVFRSSYIDGSTIPLQVRQETSYYPFGLILKHKENTTIASRKNKYLYNGKEIQRDMFGSDELNWYDYGARFYDPQIGRFTTQDRFAEKYLDFSSYQYAANNPILYIDVNGDSIGVAEEHRKALSNDLTNAFGDKASNFSYTKNGNLVYNGNGKKDFKGDQRKSFKGLDKVMSSERTTELKYSETHTDAKGIELNVVKDMGGGLYDADQNVIVISPNATDIDVWEYSGDPVQQIKNIENPTRVKQNTTSTLFHEIGEVNAGKSEYRSSVIDYENNVRGIMKMNSRPYDMHHRPKPATPTNR